MSTPRTRRRRTGNLLRVILIVLVVGGGVAWWMRSRADRSPELPRTAFYEVKRADLLVSVVEDGALRAVNETIIRSNLEGTARILSLAPEGSYVEKGDLLVELDTSAFKDRLNQQEIEYQDAVFLLAQAKENLAVQQSLAESQIKEAELRLEFAATDLAKYRDGDAPLQVRTAEARIKVLQEQVRIAEERSARTQVLFKAGNATKSEVEADNLTLKREQLALAQYQEDLRLIKKFDQPNSLRVMEATLVKERLELARLRQRTSNELAQAEADLKTSQRSLGLMEESLKQQRRRMENARILAPQDGLVIYAAVNPFQLAGLAGGEEGRPRGRDGSSGSFRDGSGILRGGGGSGPGGERRSRSRGGGGGGGSGGGGGGSSASSALSSSGGNSAATAGRTGASAGLSGAAGSGGGAASGLTGGATATSSGVGGGRAGGGGGGSFGGGAGGGSSGGGGGASFASFGSLRQSSTPPGSTSAASTSGDSSLSGASSAFGSGAGQSAYASSSFGPGSSRSSSRSGMGGGDQVWIDWSATPSVIAEGVMVRQRQELIRLPDVTKMLVEIKIPESAVRQIQPGARAVVRIENLPKQRFQGSVRRVAVMPDAQSSWLNPDAKLYSTEVLIEDELSGLKPGVSARAEILVTNLPSVLSIPIQAVVIRPGASLCYVKRGADVEPLVITTGLFNDRLIEVTSGLHEGDLVLLAPPGGTAQAGAAGTSPVSTNVVSPTPSGRPADSGPAPRTRDESPGRSDGEEAPPVRREGRPPSDPAAPRMEENAGEGQPPRERSERRGRRPRAPRAESPEAPRPGSPEPTDPKP